MIIVRKIIEFLKLKSTRLRLNGSDKYKMPAVIGNARQKRIEQTYSATAYGMSTVADDLIVMNVIKLSRSIMTNRIPYWNSNNLLR